MSYSKKTFVKKALVAATSIALGLGAVGAAHAGAMAFAVLEIGNFQILRSNGQQWDASNFTFLSVANDATVSSSLTNFAPALFNVGPSAGNVNAPMAYSGPPATGTAIGQDNFNQTNLAPGGLPNNTSHFARGDQNLQGSILSGLTGIAPSATAQTVAEVQLNQNASGVSGARVGTASAFEFSLEATETITFNFDALAELDTFLHQDEVSARANHAFSITIRDLVGNVDVFRWTPDGAAGGIFGGTEISDPFSLNNGCAVVGNALPARCTNTFTTNFNDPTNMFGAVTNNLLANTRYQLVINHDVSAAATAQVSEPFVPALLAIGLAVMGITGRRRKA